MSTRETAQGGTEHPLAGVRIIDFTQMGTGPYCTHLLTMLGAECIKVETKARLDMFRRPHPVYGRAEPAYIDQITLGKLSIQLNLKHPKGIELAKRLVQKGEIVTENFRPGVMRRLGLGYEDLRAVNPDVLMMSVSAAGQTGADSGHAGYAPVFGAAGGLGTLTGFSDGPPVEIRHVMDYGAGLNAAAALLAAYYRKRRTGRGGHVDVAAREVATSFIGDALLQQAMRGTAPGRSGNDMPGCAPHNVYRCAGEDCWVTIAVSDDRQWQALRKAANLDVDPADSRFATAAARWENRAMLDRLVSAWTAGQDKFQVTQLLQRAGVPAFPSCDSADISQDRHLNERGAIQPVTAPGGETRKMVGLPWSMQGMDKRRLGHTPVIGENNDYVYGELLGLSKGEIAALLEEKVIW